MRTGVSHMLSRNGHIKSSTSESVVGLLKTADWRGSGDLLGNNSNLYWNLDRTLELAFHELFNFTKHARP